METVEQQTVGQLVADDYRTAQVFQKFGLDFCCGGNKTIEEASAAKGVDPKLVKDALKELDTKGDKPQNYNEWPLDFLADYIINSHHHYTREKLPEVNAYAKKVAGVHGKNHPELEEIYYELVILINEITDHLDDEEAILFPYIKKLVEAEKNDKTPQAGRFGMIADPIAMMEEEHDEAGEVMAKIRRLSNDYTLPDDACTTYGLLYENLEAFETNLHKHVHLENNILFPKALELEKKLNNQPKTQKQDD